jgi:hypothetical protein
MSAVTRTNEELLDAACNGDEDALAVLDHVSAIALNA